jgi:hypothetical protein
MKKHRIAMGLAVLVMILVSDVLYADVFHGRDKETGTMISRTSVATTTPNEALSIGLQIIRIHDGNKVTVAFTSLDKALMELDTSSAALLVDGQKISLTFKRYYALTIHESLPPVHQLWFAELEQTSVAQIAKCRGMSITISSVSGVPLKRDLGAASLSDVKEVLSSNR